MNDSRILVVDDEERTRTFICDSLMVLGITDQAIAVASAEEALQEAERLPIDLVISDVRMPGLNGLDLARQLHRTHPSTRVILITGYSTRDIEHTADSLFVEALLKKPFGLDTLATTVQTALLAPHPISLAEINTGSTAEIILHRLKILRRDSGASWVGLLDDGGSIVKDTRSSQMSETTAEAIQQRAWLPSIQAADNRQGAYFAYIEQATYNLYITNVVPTYFLVLVYHRREPASRIGAVWLSARETARNLASHLCPQRFNTA
jgi:CheY-like chemotaxis protein